MKTIATAATIIILFSTGASGQVCRGVELLVLESEGLFGQTGFYGGDGWPEMTAAIDSVASSIELAANAESLTPDLADALWVDLRQPFELMPPIEISNIQEFAATGKRVVLVGEADSCCGPWNSGVRAVVGATPGSDVGMDSFLPALIHPLTAGVGSIQTSTAGTNVEGTPLFTANFATLWGDNVLTIMDTSIFGQWDSADNAAFGTNVAQWVGCISPPIFSDGFESGDTSAWF